DLFQRIADAHEQDEILRDFQIYSAPFLRKDPDVHLPVEADKHPNLFLGLADPGSAEAQAFVRRLKSNAVTGRSLNGLQPFTTEDDSIVLYQEKVGIPLCHLAHLSELAKAYAESEDPQEAHIDYEAMRGKLPEIRKFDPARQSNQARYVELGLL